ncbi:histidine utilization repressor [Rhodospirillaceae bacterium SYSU D60014]|uniref:histidine utilization repressor n=1 Tax=Virgifigura deserti TaxID=2268457 RepID=UPI000E6691AE
MPRDTLPLYLQVKQFLCEKIDSGAWPEGHHIPTEHELVSMFKVSRMTVNRALRELTAAGRLRRVPGAGTFVTDAKPSSGLLEIRNIADEIKDRGHVHSSEVRLLKAETANRAITDALGLDQDAVVFRSMILHFEEGWPIQLEDRYVNPDFAPDYLAQDFTSTTPNAYLMSLGPLDRAEHRVEAIRPTAAVQRQLRISADEPCLLLHRRTWSGRHIVTRAWLTHPGSRYRLGAQFSGRH